MEDQRRVDGREAYFVHSSVVAAGYMYRFIAMGLAVGLSFLDPGNIDIMATAPAPPSRAAPSPMSYETELLDVGEFSELELFTEFTPPLDFDENTVDDESEHEYNYANVTVTIWTRQPGLTAQYQPQV